MAVLGKGKQREGPGGHEQELPSVGASAFPTAPPPPASGPSPSGSMKARLAKLPPSSRTLGAAPSLNLDAALGEEDQSSVMLREEDQSVLTLGEEDQSVLNEPTNRPADAQNWASVLWSTCNEEASEEAASETKEATSEQRSRSLSDPMTHALGGDQRQGDEATDTTANIRAVATMSRLVSAKAAIGLLPRLLNSAAAARADKTKPRSLSPS